VKEGTTESVAI